MDTGIDVDEADIDVYGHDRPTGGSATDQLVVSSDGVDRADHLASGASSGFPSGLSNGNSLRTTRARVDVIGIGAQWPSRAWITIARRKGCL